MASAITQPRKLKRKDARYQYQINLYLEDARDIANAVTAASTYPTTYDFNVAWDAAFHTAMDELTHRAGLRTQAWQVT